ncbi:unnamed protein product [Rotaria socialis]|uniref:NAD(P)(+)--arginine ADP-ribosyltransferase n=1 Tax=Rotaria socialis TaxID=392032 RepID=A0A818JL57_9BILA|nr:unnamed protein product [Rotaria socialis]CAF4410772.1 unnamed protein product [Rotaria socialis]
MASFEPIIVIFGSSKSIASTNLRLPVSLLFAFDVKSLEEIVNASSKLTDTCLSRFFIILLDCIDEDLLIRLHANHRVQSIYKHCITSSASQQQINRMTNSFRQLTLDLSNDIVYFLTAEGEKQITLEQISLVKIYYQQARILKQWIMSFFKAEPCHILLISLNSSQENLDSAQQRLQQVCIQLGFSSAVIRQLNDYIPNSERNSVLLPYAELLFKNEDPHYICRLIKQLSPIRLYLYGNKLCDLSEWSKLMIATENEIMEDEDDWCAFLENDYVEDEVKWNFGFIFGKGWKLSRVSPLDLNELHENLRFHSAIRRAFSTFAQRQVEVTADIFDWHQNCIKQRYLQEEPELIHGQKRTKYDSNWEKFNLEFSRRHLFRNLSYFDYNGLDSPKNKSISFIWLDEILHDAEFQFQQIVEPFQWQFFDNVSSCVLFLEKQLREQRYVFLVTSGVLGKELFISGLCVMDQLFATYVYCAQLSPNLNWSRDYSKIRGIYNDSNKLAYQLKRDYKQLQAALGICETECYTVSKITNEKQIIQNVEEVNLPLPLPLPLIIYDQEHTHLFMAHQRTIDTLLCMPHTLESKADMLAEFRHAYSDNQEALAQIDNFENIYNSNAAVQWYTRDSFVWRTINQALRSSNVESMFKLRYILTDLYAHLQESYDQKHLSFQMLTPEIFYRGQMMSREEFNTFKTLQGNIIAINTFLSTTASMQIALMYAGQYCENPDLVSVVFHIETNMGALVRPYANISHYSLFRDEQETLFAMGSVFRIGNIRQLPNADYVWTIHLKTIDQTDSQFSKIH